MTTMTSERELGDGKGKGGGRGEKRLKAKERIYFKLQGCQLFFLATGDQNLSPGALMSPTPCRFLFMFPESAQALPR